MHKPIALPPVRGIRVYIHWTFLLLFGWILLASIVQENNMPGLWLSVFLFFAVFFCVLLHELAHSLAAAHFKVKADDIVLLPIEEVAGDKKYPDDPKQELITSFAGPLVNLLIAFILFWLLRSYSFFPGDLPGSGPTRISVFLYSLYLVNIVFAAFNLIPAFPMDGGRMLRAVLMILFHLNYTLATKTTVITGKLIAVVFIGTGLLLLNPVLWVIGIFIILAAGTEEYYLRLRSQVKGIKLKEVMGNDYNSLPASMPIKEATQVLLNNCSDYFILVEGAKPLGAISRSAIIKSISVMQHNEPLKHLLKGERLCLYANEEVENVLNQLTTNEKQVYPVIENGRLAGTTSFAQIIEYLLLHASLTKEHV